MAQRVTQPEPTGEGEPDVAGVAPVGQGRIERDGPGVDLPAQRLEQAARSVLPAAARHGGQVQGQRQRLGGEFGARLARSPQRGAEDVAQRDREQRRGRVGPVVDVLRQREARGPRPGSAGAQQRLRVHLQQQRCGAALGGGLGVEDVGRAVGLGEPLDPVRMLVQQETEVGRGLAGGGDRQQHGTKCGPRRGRDSRRFRLPVDSRAPLRVLRRRWRPGRRAENERGASTVFQHCAGKNLALGGTGAPPARPASARAAASYPTPSPSAAAGTISGAPCCMASASTSLSCSWAARSASMRLR